MTQDNILKQFANLLNGATTPKLSINQAWDNFINYSSLKCRKDTIEYYNKFYKRIKLYLDNINIFYIEDITKHILNDMIHFLKSRKLSNNTINKYIEIMKMIVKYNHDNDYIQYNNIGSFKKLPKTKSKIEIINKDSELLILKYINNLDLNVFLNLRNVTFLYLFQNTGVRLNEMLNIEIDNINLKNNSIFLSFTKTKETRHVFFTEGTKALLIKYLELIKGNKYLFSDTDNKPMHKDCVYRFLKQIKSKLNIKQSITPHKWRHTLATKLVANDINLESVRNILGHTTLNTTQKYLHLDLDKIKKDLLKVL